MSMGPLRDLWADLVDKRLWPLALVLVAALVAIPLVLAKSPSSSGASGGEPDSSLAAPASGTGGPAPGSEPAVSVAATVAGGAPLGGHAKDPFKQQFPAAKQASAGAAVPGTSGAKAGSGAGSSGGSGTGSNGGSPVPSGGTPTTPPKTYAIAHIDVRFGRAAAPLRTIKDVPRLTPLPNAIDPVVIFLGMSADQQTAVFLISSDVHPQGDGRCTPSVKTCTSIELKQGQTEILDVTGSDGSVTEYELDLDSVVVQHTTSKSAAHAALATKPDAAIARAALARAAATDAHPAPAGATP
jgi:hypothetical protein